MENVRSHERDDYDKNADLYDRATLIDIVKAVQGHPLAASNAVKYIIRVSKISFWFLHYQQVDLSLTSMSNVDQF